MSSRILENQPMRIVAPFTAMFATGSDPNFVGDTYYNRKDFEDFSPGDMIIATFRIGEKGNRRLLSVRREGAPAPLPVIEIETKTEIKTKIEKKKDERAKLIRVLSESVADLLKGYYISPEMRLAFTAAKKMSTAAPDKAIKLLMVGPSGYGKTTLPWLFSQVTGAGFYRMNCATIRDPEEWFGYREAKDGTTIFIKSEFIKLVERGNLVVVLDEFNRLEPWLHNTLFPLLDDDGKTVVHDEEFSIGPNVIVVATINSGYKFTGTFELDEALMNRFDFVLEVGAMPKGEEAKVLVQRAKVEKDIARQIVNAATDLRQMNVVCSTRTTLLIARMFNSGLSLRESFESAVVRRIGRDESNAIERKKVIDLLNVQFGVLSDRKLTDDVFDVFKKDEEPAETKDVADPLIPEVELEGEDGYRITVSKSPTASVNRLYAAQTLRTANHHMSLKEGVDAVDAVINGNTIHVYCQKDLIAEVISKLKSAGLTGTYNTIKISSWFPTYQIV